VCETDRIAGKDATTVFYGLHRSEVLQRPQYQKLKIGQIEGQSQKIRPQLAGEASRVSQNIESMGATDDRYLMENLPG
jgi:hypothetical protein